MSQITPFTIDSARQRWHLHCDKQMEMGSEYKNSTGSNGLLIEHENAAYAWYPRVVGARIWCISDCVIKFTTAYIVP